MIFELRTYQIKVGKIAHYVKQFEEMGLPIVSRYCKIEGYWTTEIGELNQVVNLMSFPDLEARRKAREKWWQDREWLEEYLPLALPLVLRQENKILASVPFSPIR